MVTVKLIGRFRVIHLVFRIEAMLQG